MIEISNPFNIRYNKRNKWLGQIGNVRGFAQFSDWSYGCRAAMMLLRNYIRNGYDTPRKIIYRFAPPNDGNDTERYLDFVCRPWDNLVDNYRDTPIASKEELYDLMTRMAKMETSSLITLEQFQRFEKRFGLNMRLKPYVLQTLNFKDYDKKDKETLG